MDLTLIFATVQKPDPSKERKDVDYILVNNEEFGGDIYVYRRPHMQEFI